MKKSITILVFLAILICSGAFCADDPGTECSLADGCIVVHNPLKNWSFSKYAGENECKLEKSDSPENIIYLSAKIDIYYYTRDRIGVTVDKWSSDLSEHTINIVDPIIVDTTLNEKAGKKLTYYKMEANFDKTDTLKVLHEDYLAVEKDYAIQISVRYAEAEAATTAKEVQEIISKIVLK